MNLIKNLLFKQLLNKSIVAFTIKILGAFIGLAASFYLTKILGSEQSGLYFLALSFMTFPVALCALGLNNTVLKLISSFYTEGNWGAINSVTSKSILWVFSASVIFSCLIFYNAEYIATVVFSKSALEPALKFIAFSLIFTCVFNLYGHIIQAVRRLKSSMIIMGVSHNLFLIITLTLIVNVSLKSAAIAYSISAFFTMLVGMFVWLKLKEPVPKANVSTYLIISTCTPMLVIQLFAQINAQAGTIMLGVWHTPESVAFYVISVKIAALISFILMAVNRVVGPDFSSLYAMGDINKLAKTVQYSTALMVIFSLPLLLLFLIAPGTILGIFGEDFREAKNVLRILAVAQFFYVASGNVNLLLQMTGHANILRNNILISSLVAVLLGLFLIPSYGVHGAGITTALALTVSNILSCYKVHSLLKINIIRFW
jgi:O-antigen/teichoic acid export membrane protein